MHLIYHLPHRLRKQLNDYGKVPSKGRNYVGTQTLRIADYA